MVGRWPLPLACPHRGRGRHDGAVFGAGTVALSSRDGKRPLALGWNLICASGKYQRLNEDGTGWEPSPIDDALNEHITRALHPTTESPSASPAESGRLVQERLPGVDLTSGTWATRR